MNALVDTLDTTEDINSSSIVDENPGGEKGVFGKAIKYTLLSTAIKKMTPGKNPAIRESILNQVESNAKDEKMLVPDFAASFL